MLCRSTLAECREGALYLSRFGVGTSSVSPMKDFTINRRRWWHGGLTLTRGTAQSRSIPNDVVSHFLQWTCVKDISSRYSLEGIWPRFGDGTFITFFVKGPSLRGSFIFYPIPQYTSSTIARLSAQRRRASWYYIFALYGRCVFNWLNHLLNWYHGRT